MASKVRKRLNQACREGRNAGSYPERRQAPKELRECNPMLKALVLNMIDVKHGDQPVMESGDAEMDRAMREAGLL